MMNVSYVLYDMSETDECITEKNETEKPQNAWTSKVMTVSHFMHKLMDVSQRINETEPPIDASREQEFSFKFIMFGISSSQKGGGRN